MKNENEKILWLSFHGKVGINNFNADPIHTFSLIKPIQVR